MFIDLLKNASFVLALSFILSFVVRRWRDGQMMGMVVSGLLFGSICMAAMTVPIHFADGVIFDARFIILSVGSFFGGPIVAVISGLISIAYRLWLGGPGAVVSIGAVVSSIGIGLLYRFFHHKKNWPIGPAPFFIFGLIVHISVTFWFFLLPADVALQAIQNAAVPFVLVFSPATAAFAYILSDIKKRQALERDLQAKTTFLKEAEKLANMGHWSINADTGQLFWSDEVYRIHGQEPGNLVDVEAAINAYHPDDREKVKECVRRALEQKENYNFKLRIIRADGEVRYVTSTGIVVLKENGDVESLFGIFRDVTELTNAQQELEKNKQELELRVEERTHELTKEIERREKTEKELLKLTRAVEQSSTAIFITDLSGTIEYVNPTFTTLLGYTSEEALGQKPSILKSSDTPIAMYEDLWQTILSGNEWHGEIKDRRKDGEVFWAAVTITPVKDSTGVISHFVAMHENITERKIMDQEKEAARVAAEIASKAKTDLLANMSHELRTPLNAIIGFSDSMQSAIFGPIGDDRYNQYIQHINGAGRHLLELINDILDVSSIEAGKMELRKQETSIDDVCTAVFSIIHPKASEKKISLNRNMPENMPLLWVDTLRIKQVLINLLSNAVKFTQENGVIECSVVVDPQVGVTISIVDNGIGMDSRGVSTALETFGQVDSSLARTHEGTGLGLPLTKGLVELHGGRLEIDSAIDVGTTVKVILPPDLIIHH